jgi:iron complex transport system ATP-binding protein
MHDLNLAALYFDRLMLINDGRIVTAGSPGEVLSAERVQAVFGAEVLVQPHPTRAQIPQIVLLPGAKN